MKKKLHSVRFISGTGQYMQVNVKNLLSVIGILHHYCMCVFENVIAKQSYDNLIWDMVYVL